MIGYFGIKVFPKKCNNFKKMVIKLSFLQTKWVSQQENQIFNI